MNLTTEQRLQLGDIMYQAMCIMAEAAGRQIPVPAEEELDRELAKSVAPVENPYDLGSRTVQQSAFSRIVAHDTWQVVIPAERQRNFSGYMRWYRSAVEDHGQCQDDIARLLARYYASDEGRGMYGRMPASLLEQEFWHESSEAWDARADTSAETDGARAIREELNRLKETG